MSFVSPLWLVGLLPWGAVVVWLLTGRRQRAEVPFLELWKGSEAPPPQAKRAMHVPPLAILCAMSAMLLAILAAGRPVLRGIGGGRGPAITIIIDRGMTMSARDRGQPRWRQLAREIQPVIESQFGAGPVELIFVPDGKTVHATRSTWLADVEKQQPTTVDTRELVSAVVTSARSRDDQPVIVLTDLKLHFLDSLLMQIAPADQPQNVGIVSADLRAGARSQVMVRLRNDSDRASADLTVGSVTAPISLPARGQEKNYFVDLDALGDQVVIAVSPEDDQPADNRAALRRAGNWPAIEPRGELPQPVLRMLQTYSQVRPPTDRSTPLVISTSPVTASQPAVMVMAPAAPGSEGAVHAIDHPINANLDWSKIVAGGVQVAPLPEGWTPLVSAGDAPIVAVRESAVRQVWVGFNSETFPKTGDFVVFWTNLLDWVGQGADRFALDSAPSVPIPPPLATDWRGRIAAIPPARRGGVDIFGVLLIGSISLIFVACLAWGTCKNCAVG